MNNTYILKYWSVVSYSEYSPPEEKRRIRGQVYGHPGFHDGKIIFTSGIVNVQGNIITTESGSQYQLDWPPDPHWMKWLSDNNIPLPTPECPIRIKTLPGEPDCAQKHIPYC